MKKNTANSVNQRLKNQNAEKQANSKKIIDISNKLLKNEALDEENFEELGRRIAIEHGYDTNQIIICSVDDLNDRLKLFKAAKSIKTVFVICRKEKMSEFIFCIVSHLDKTICLFRHFLRTTMIEDVRNTIRLSFGEKVDFKIYTRIEVMENEKKMDLLALKTLDTMMTNLMSERRKNFIEGFDNRTGSFFNERDTDSKSSLFSLIKNEYDLIVGNDLEVLSTDKNFKKEIKKFINNTLLLKEGGDVFTNYQTLEKDFANLIDSGMDPNSEEIKNLSQRIVEAKKDAHSRAENLVSNFPNNKENNHELDIVSKFPKQMKMFTGLFESLVHSEVDDKLNKRLSEICQKLDLDYKAVRSFFAAQKIEKKKENTTNVTKDIEDVIKVLKPFKTGSYTDPEMSSLDQLLEDIVTDTLSTEALQEGHRKVKDFHKLWEAKTAQDIRMWADSKRGNLADSEMHEALGILDRANGLVTGGHRFRDPQILSMLVFLAQSDKGHLSQIQTGEGKTMIVSILSAIKVLQGRKVDVITSNPVLAKDGVRERQLFFDLLNITVTTNNLSEDYIGGERECYRADVVYGSIANFQFDFLKDVFMGHGTRAGRPFETVFLDEVDNMIIDNANHIAKLSGPFPGMDALKYIYIKIWQELYKAETKVIEENEVKLKEKAKELETLDEDDADKQYVKFISELIEAVAPDIKNHIKLANPTKIDIIPSHIQDYADASLDRWIDNAIGAKFTYREDEQYIIREKDGEAVIQPVDNENTGITMKNTIWQHGLHQFLQLKHNLRLTSESLTSCFISNLGYINKYGSKIYGLTGTLGSKPEQELLSSIYNVGFSEVPPFKRKKFSEIEGHVANDGRFNEFVTDYILDKVDSGRSCLVICETIKDASEINSELMEKREILPIRIYFDEDNSKATERKLKPGEVVVATNIAGRGTDFKTTKELESNGGLHVCVAFLPYNKRVENQAFGRTARQGNRGTANLLLKHSEVEELGIESENFDAIKLQRDLKEKERIRFIKEFEVRRITFQDKLFELFCDLYRNLKSENQMKSGYSFVLDDLKEFWAFWLEKKNYGKSDLTNKKPTEEFEDFRTEAKSIIDGKISFNPFYAIQQAGHFISNDKFDEAKWIIDHAIDICKNPELLHGAYVKLFEIAIEQGGVLMERFTKALKDVFFITDIGNLFGSIFYSTSSEEAKLDYKGRGKMHLEKAKVGLQKEIDCIDRILKHNDDLKINERTPVDDLHNDPVNLFLKHMMSKRTALNFYVAHYDSLIKQINKGTGIAIANRSGDYLTKLEEQNDDDKRIGKVIKVSEVAELQTIGADTIYSLREVLAVPQEIIRGAQIQITSGIAILAAGLIFLPVLPIASSIASTLIVDGVCDIVFELIKPTSSPFDLASYIKDKALSHALNFLTMGLDAIIKCAKVLKLVSTIFRSLAKVLRKCPYFKRVFTWLANRADKISVWFDKMATLAKYSKMSEAAKTKYGLDLDSHEKLKNIQDVAEKISESKKLLDHLKKTGELKQITHYQKNITALKAFSKKNLRSMKDRTIENVIVTRVLTPGLTEIMKGLKPGIRDLLEKSGEKRINRDKLKLSTKKDIDTAISISMKKSYIEDFLKKASVKIINICGKWKVLLATKVLSQIFAWQELITTAVNLCENFNDNIVPSAEKENDNVDHLFDYTVDKMAEKVYTALTEKTAKLIYETYKGGEIVYQNVKRKPEVKEESESESEDERQPNVGTSGIQLTRSQSTPVKDNSVEKDGAQKPPQIARSQTMPVKSTSSVEKEGTQKQSVGTSTSNNITRSQSTAEKSKSNVEKDGAQKPTSSPGTPIVRSHSMPVKINNVEKDGVQKPSMTTSTNILKISSTNGKNTSTENRETLQSGVKGNALQTDTKPLGNVLSSTIHEEPQELQLAVFKVDEI